MFRCAANGIICQSLKIKISSRGARVASPLGEGERMKVRGGFVEQAALFALTQPSPSPLARER
jgi:hypothetical protein